MSITRLVLRRPYSAVMILLAIAVFGITSIFGFRMELIPDLDMPIQLVMVTYTGADPESVDDLVLTPIEGKVQSLSGVKSVTSYSYENYGVVMLQYEYGTDSNENFMDLRTALDSTKAELPEDCGDPIIIEMDIDAAASMIVTATAKNGADILAFLDDGMKDELESLTSVAQVSVSGGREDYIRVLLRQDMLDQFGLTMATVSTYIAATDFMIPIGSLDQGSQSINATSTADNTTVQQISQIPLFTSTGATITLADVADVEWAEKEAKSISRLNGEDAVTISLTKNQSAGTVNLSNDVKKLLKKYESQNDDIHFEIFYDAADDILSSLKSVGSTLILGIILSMLVLFVFFGDIRASLVVGSSMPISLLITLIMMHFMGFSMNVVTMGALVIAIGMMVDSSIVVLESCFRIHEEEADIHAAALEGTRLVLSSIIASTITTIVVYVPLATMKGMSGQMFSQLGFTIVFAMIASLLSAMAFVPLFFTIFKPKAKDDVPINHLLEKMYTWYNNNIRKLMYRKKTVIVVSIALLIASFGLFSVTEQELIPETEGDTINVTATYRDGTKLSAMDERASELEKILTSYDDVESYSMTAGRAEGTSMSSGGSTYASSVMFTLNLKEDRERSTTDIKAELLTRLQDLPGADITVSSADNGMGSMTSEGPNIVIESFDADIVKEAASELAERTSALAGVMSVSSTTDTAATRIDIVIDPLMAAKYGMTPAQVAGTLYSMVSGTEAMTITSNGSEYSVYLEYPAGAYDTPNSLMSATITSATGNPVPISEIATLEYTDGQDTIIKQDGKYQATISAVCLEDNEKAVQDAMDEMVKKTGLPDNVELSENAVDEMMNEEFSAIGTAVATAIFLIFLVMAIQFESPRFSAMVMMSIPFSLIGSFFLLFITGSSISMTSLMGILMLVGIVVNNGILYVDTANMLIREQHMEIEDALSRSGSLRLRPILMTTLTTILSMVPMGLGIGDGTVIMQGMALIIIGGLITSTMLILLLLPSFYLMFYGRRTKRLRSFQG